MSELFDDYTLKDLIPLVSAIVVVIGWFITYLLNRSQKLHDIFLAKTEMNLKDVCGPLFSEMESIFEQKHPASQMRSLELFIKKLGGTSSPIFLESNKQIIAQTKALKSSYMIYKSNPTHENHNFLWSSFLALQESFSIKIKEYRVLLFKHYDWKYRMDRLNPILRLLCETFRIGYVSVTGFTMIGGGLCLLTLTEQIERKFMFSNDYPALLVPYQAYIYSFSLLFFLIWIFAAFLNKAFIGYRIENVWIVKKDEKTMKWFMKKYADNFLFTMN